ncbi:MAG: serine/threonine-protein kinase, partial [Gemmatimonadota bacterium]
MGDLLRQLQQSLGQRYQLERELGRGGMAVVYLATDTRHHRAVAIKVLLPELANAVGQERFLREIRFAAELNHPHIIPLLDSGTAETEGTSLPYFVMPCVAGESLRARLAREKQLPLLEALAIALDVASALSYAHARGIVHRDIKPENILLTNSEAVVADFGIARAIDRSADPDALTSSGLAVGTPAYMSPEQASAESELDGRTDVYALGCVLYEMLGGAPPFSGTSANAILARHRMDSVPSLRIVRPTVSPAVELAIMRALQKIPADRFASAGHFAAALEGQISPTPTPVSIAVRRRGRHRALVSALAGLGVLAVIGAGMLRQRSNAKASGCAPEEQCELDTTRYAILSMEQSDVSPEESNPAQSLQDALARWDGVNVVDPFQIRDALSRKNPASLRAEDWQRLAISLGAGRYIRGSVFRKGDSLQVRATLFDTRRNVVIETQSAGIGLSVPGRDLVYTRLADQLLFGTAERSAGTEKQVGTRSAPARQAFSRGHAALVDWNLAMADTAFAAATEFDGQYAEAFLWLALVRSWSGAPVESWSSASERAAAGLARLSGRDQAIAKAVLEESRGSMVQACLGWQQLTRFYPYDFATWYGSADCQARDESVISDPSSPSGWRF